MKNIIYLDGLWGLRLDPDKKGIEDKFYLEEFEDKIMLPSTLALAKKGEKNPARETGCLTAAYKYEGFAWFQRKLIINEITEENAKLFLERTRKTMVWLNGKHVGGLQESLSTPHVYEVGEYLATGENIITIMVDNTDYLINGRRLVSSDTQTNWNGITGEIALKFYSKCYIDNVRIFPDVKDKSARVKLRLNGTDKAELSAYVYANDVYSCEQQFEISANENGIAEFTYIMDDNIKLWSEYSPVLYTMVIELANGEQERIKFGMRDFSVCGNELRLNDKPVFLRGKRDGLLFPLTGTAPTDVASWTKIFKTAKEYGINNYRFYACCPPDAAFTAADALGMYIEPELPFYIDETEEYFVSEGLRIIDAFGNHPSFCMFSFGDNIDGNSERINEIMKKYKEHDNRHLYTMCVNNFEHIAENADICRISRFDDEKAVRGSFAAYDVLSGHVQTSKPDTCFNYDLAEDNKLSLKVPVISNEIGQYTFYPDFNEIEKYTGVLKARNLETFREQLEEKGMLVKSARYFKACGIFAAECYKNEIESIMRSEKLAGFQLSDLQDFYGQGTALVGILNSFMENKGIISAEKWRGFCSDKVLLAKFDDYVITGSVFKADVSVRCNMPDGFSDDYIRWEISYDGKILEGGEIIVSEKRCGLVNVGTINWNVPDYKKPKKITLTLAAKGVENSYNLWVFPEIDKPVSDIITDDINTALETVKNGGSVLLITDKLKDSIKGTYCTDFWCYSYICAECEDMGKLAPIGTMGLLIDKNHDALSQFESEIYSTPQWYNIVNSGVCAILDDAPKKYFPIVQTVDNWERNHKLGNVFEAKVSEGKLMVCTMSLEKLMESSEGRWFIKSVSDYCQSSRFNPRYVLEEEYVKSLFV